jgi:hypothetical protein
MTTPAMSRDEFIALLEDCIQQRCRAELRRLRICAELSEQIAVIVDQHPGKGYRQVAAELGPDEGTHLLELMDRLEAESMCAVALKKRVR